MSLLQALAGTFLVFLILTGIWVSLYALSNPPILQETLDWISHNPLVLFPVSGGVLLLVFLAILLWTRESEEENPEPLEFEKSTLTVTYPAIDLQTIQPITVEQVEEHVTLPKNEPEFKRFLKNAILELEREKARIYHEISLLDQDYRKGILTEKEFLTGTELLLSDQSLEQVIEEKDVQIQHLKEQLQFPSRKGTEPSSKR